MDRQACFQWRRTLAALFDPAVIGQDVGVAIDHPLDATTCDRFKYFDFLGFYR